MNKQTLFLVALFISVAAGIFGTIPGLPLRVAQEIIVACSVIILLSLFYIQNPWLKIFGAWHVVRTIMFINEPAVFTMYMTAAVFFLYQFIINISTDDFIPRLLNIVCVILILQSLMVICQFLGLWIAYTPLPGNGPDEWIHYRIHDVAVSITKYPLFCDKWRAMVRIGALAGTTGNTNIASSMFAVGLVAFFRRGWIVFSPLMILCLIIMHSLTGIITATSVACLYLMFKYGRKATVWILAVVAGFGMYFYFNETFSNVINFSTRLPAWKIYVKELIAMRPWAGWGVAQSPFVAHIINKYVPGELWRHPHNEYINLALEVGIIGLIPAIGYIITAARRGFATARKGGIYLIVYLGSIGGLFSVIGNFNFHVSAGIITLFFLAMLEYLNKRRLEDEKNNDIIHHSIPYPGNISC